MRFVKFGLVGVVNTAVAYGVFLLLALGLAVPPTASHAAGWLAGMATSWLLNRLWTFGDRVVSLSRALPRFAVANLVVMGAGAAALGVAAGPARAAAVGAGASGAAGVAVLEALVLAASVVLNYMLATLWVFRSSPAKD
ncbi:MAG: GtrA family protein [Anaerosomatales bacterium]|nr:GtrA family protein [Anaerosomatales bacterium]